MVVVRRGPFQRLRAYVEENKLSQTELARRIGCHPSYARLLLIERKLPGRMISHAIERETAGWELGPIAAEEWDHEERRRDAGDASTGTEG